MKTLLISAANVAVTLALIAANTPAGASVCFYPSTAKAYRGQGYAGYTFKIQGRPGARLVLETRGNPGLIVCDETKRKDDRLDKLFPNLGC